MGNQVGGKIWKTKECEDLWGFRVNRHRQICFGNGEYGPCLGDSGGPLVCFPSTVESKRGLATQQIRSTENTTTAAAANSATKGPLEEAVLVGVVSFGTQTCDKKGWPGVFTSVTYHSEWIRQYLWWAARVACVGRKCHRDFFLHFLVWSSSSYFSCSSSSFYSRRRHNKFTRGVAWRSVCMSVWVTGTEEGWRAGQGW